jgi:excisionase family DNA binding protein
VGPLYDEVPDDVAGLVGKLTARSEAHVLRLAMIYAVADRSTRIRLAHLDAALSVWAYCERTVAWIWGAATGNRDADKILARLRDAERAGLSRTAIRDLFSHSKNSGAIDDALAVLIAQGLAVTETVQAGARTAQWWWATEFASTGTQGTEGTQEARNGPAPVLPGPFGPLRPTGSENDEMVRAFRRRVRGDRGAMIQQRPEGGQHMSTIPSEHPLDVTPELLTIAEAAVFLRIWASMVRKLTAEGRLPCVQIGARTLYRREDLTSYVAALAGRRRPRR